MRKCKQILELYSESFDRELSFGEKVSMYLHLGLCSICKCYRDQISVIRHEAKHLHHCLEEGSLEPEECLTDDARVRLKSTLEQALLEK